MDIEQIERLRHQGLSLREIERSTGVPKSTVHKMLRGKDVTETAIRKVAMLVHMPWTYFCPSCGQQQQHLFLCTDCGKFFPSECGCAEKEFEERYLSEFRRGRWIGE